MRPLSLASGLAIRGLVCRTQPPLLRSICIKGERAVRYFVDKSYDRTLGPVY